MNFAWVKYLSGLWGRLVLYSTRQLLSKSLVAGTRSNARYAFVAELDVEPFEVRVLHRLSRPNKRQLYASLLGPDIEGSSGERRPDNHVIKSQKATHQTTCRPFRCVAGNINAAINSDSSQELLPNGASP